MSTKNETEQEWVAPTFPIDSFAPDRDREEYKAGIFTSAELAIKTVRKIRTGRQIFLFIGVDLAFAEDQSRGLSSRCTIPISFDSFKAWTEFGFSESHSKRGLGLKISYCSNCIFIG